MSRIDDLIREHCPDGVPFRHLSEVARRNSGTPITAARMKTLQVEGGAVRIFAGGNTRRKQYEHYRDRLLTFEEAA